MKYVLDTNAVSALMKGEAVAIAKLSSLRRADVSIPQPVVAEILYGIQRLARGARRDRLLARFDLLRQELARSVWSDEVSALFADVKAKLERKGTRIEDFDAAVAAHALAHDAILVSADARHMARITDLNVLDWSAPDEK